MLHLRRPHRAGALLLFCLLSCSGLQAEASGEKPALTPQRLLTVYLVLTPEESRNSMLVERLQLPSTLAALAWTRFSLIGSGNVDLEALGGYRVLSRKPLAEEPIGGYGIYSYALELSYTGRTDYAPKRTFNLSFDYRFLAENDGGVVIQPAHRALLEGIRRSGRQTGVARVLELRYRGAGRFTARVAVL
jgi:hypothetical protein